MDALSLLRYMLVCCLWSVVTSQSGPVVRVENGEIQGRRSLDPATGRYWDGFFGVPFARPPLGALRFRKPEPALDWSGVRQATTFSKACIQAAALHADVIHVSFNYRLISLGFLSTETPDVPGNYGMWDMVAALRWLQRNIRAFNGDPNRVTIYGQSAGGGATSLLMLAPQARGLFKGVIAQSGGATAPWAVQAGHRGKADFLARHLNCTTTPVSDMMTCLRNKPAIAFANAIMDNYFNGAYWSPRVDLDLLPCDLDRLIRQSFIEDYDYMGGAIYTEGYLRVRNEDYNASDPAQFMGTIRKVVDTYYPGRGQGHVFHAIRHRYFPPAVREGGPQALLDAGAAMFHDLMFASSQEKLAQMKLSTRGTAYTYDFRHLPSFSPYPVPTHTDELDFVHGFPLLQRGRNSSVPGFPRYTEAEIQFSDALVNYWTNFAKTGNPNHPRPVPVSWPEYDIENKTYMVLNLTLSRDTHKREGLYEFFNYVVSTLHQAGSVSSCTPAAEHHPCPTPSVFMSMVSFTLVAVLSALTLAAGLLVLMNVYGRTHREDREKSRYI